MHISSKCSVAVHCLILINEFGNEKRVTSDILSMSCGINPVTVRGIMSALKKDGIISVKSGTGGAVMCCPLGEITLYRICSAVEPDFLEKLFGIHSTPSPICPVGKNIGAVLEKPYQSVKSSLADKLKTITMADIIADYRDILNDQSQLGSSGVT